MAVSPDRGTTLLPPDPASAVTGLPLLAPDVMEQIQQHVNSAWARGVGGILLGRSLDGRTRVETAVPARRTEEHRGENAFLPEVWEDAYSRLGAEGPGSKIVGWYHSHPGAGTAFSGYDRRLHATLFSEPSNVALVLDPLAQKMSWFGWLIGELSLLDSTVGAAETPSRPSRAAVALLAAGIAAAGVGGYWVGRSTSSGRAAPAGVAGADLREARVQARAFRLRLLRTERQLQAVQARLASTSAQLDAAERSLAQARRAAEDARRALRRHRAEPRMVTVHYRVRATDTLWNLAQSFYGRGESWPRILDANRDRILNPDRLYVGQELRIPLRPA